MVTRKYTGCTDYGKNVCYFHLTLHERELWLP
jgi:hypothetical protein